MAHHAKMHEAPSGQRAGRESPGVLRGRRGESPHYYEQLSMVPPCFHKQKKANADRFREAERMHSSLSWYLWGFGQEPDQVMTVAYRH